MASHHQRRLQHHLELIVIYIYLNIIMSNYIIGKWCAFLEIVTNLNSLKNIWRRLMRMRWRLDPCQNILNGQETSNASISFDNNNKSSLIMRLFNYRKIYEIRCDGVFSFFFDYIYFIEAITPIKFYVFNPILDLGRI